MEQSSDFSFHKGNQFPSVEEEESPKPMPHPPILPIKDSTHQDSDVADAIEVNKGDQQESLQSVEVLETLTIAPVANAFKTPTNRHGVTTVSLPPPKLLSTQVSSSALNSRRRAKIPLERGFTQVDWMRLTKTNPDLAGLNGTSNQRLIPMEEIRQHENEENAWTIFRGKVYNITSYLKFHPGGKDKLMEGAGKDCTALFNKYHAWVNAEFLLEKCLVGYLDVPDSNTK